MHRRRVLQALIRSNFTAFTQKAFATLNPGQVFVPNWHIEAIAYQLERVRRGEIRRLIINMPPRSLKSITARREVGGFGQERIKNFAAATEPRPTEPATGKTMSAFSLKKVLVSAAPLAWLVKSPVNEPVPSYWPSL